MGADLKAPPNTVVILGGTPYRLSWDKGAMYLADELGLFEKRKPGLGLAVGAKYVWAMAPEAAREKYPTPKAIAEVLGELSEVWDAINNAVALAKDTGPKNASGSTNGPSPASS